MKVFHIAMCVASEWRKAQGLLRNATGTGVRYFTQDISNEHNIALTMSAAIIHYTFELLLGSYKNDCSRSNTKAKILLAVK